MKLTGLSLTAGLITCICSVGPIRRAQAGPVGPSAKMAAQLKKYPTSKWLAHYLPDDRYKIAGGVWKYVSTDLDTYYHRPDSPLMMRQSASRVIGFASAAEAEEAGYKPAPGGMGFGSEAGSSSTEIAGTRIVLSDGKSSIVLPRGWTKRSAVSARTNEMYVVQDFLNGPKGQRIRIDTTVITVAQRINTGTTVAEMKEFQAGLAKLLEVVEQQAGNSMSASSRASINQAKKIFAAGEKYNKIVAVTLNGHQGIGVFPSQLFVPGQANRTFMFGGINKIWNIYDYGKSASVNAPIIKTIQMR